MYESTALLTDMYELTMIDAAVRAGAAERSCVFEVFTRRIPAGRRFAVLAGNGRLLDELERFRFGEAEMDYLRSANILSEEALEYLADYRFRGTIRSYGEGETFFPGSPVMTVEGTFADTVILETLVLSILNYDSAVASAASRMTIAAHGRPILEMGARRAHERAAVAAARAASIAGFVGTSDLEAARLYGLTPIGTAAHSFTLLFDDEEEAFDAQIATLGAGTTLLVDTYDVEKGIENAVAAARRAGGELGAVRIDSGDLLAQAFTVRQQLDDLGCTSTRITVTSDLDEYAIASLQAAPVDSYGVGTRVVTGSGHPTASLVYKLVARENRDGVMEPVAKKSAAKESKGGRKFAGRVIRDGHAAEEVTVEASTEEAARAHLEGMGARPLWVPLVTDGEIHEEHRGAEGVRAAVERHRASLEELPYPAWRLSDGEPALLTRHIGRID